MIGLVLCVFVFMVVCVPWVYIYVVIYAVQKCINNNDDYGSSAEMQKVNNEKEDTISNKNMH